MLQVLLRASGILYLLILASTQPVWAGQKNPGELRIFASVGLTESLTEIAQKYELATGQKVRLNFAGTNLNAQQIEMGVPCDLFISADTYWYDYLSHKQLLRTDSQLDWIATRLVIVVNKESPLVITRPEDLLQPKVGRIALSDSTSASSGMRSRIYLEKHAIWDQIEPRVIMTSNARATVAAVEQDRVGAGFAYSTDVLVAHGARIAYEVPLTEVPPVHFIAVITRSCTEVERTSAFLKALNQPDALAIFKRYGFIILPPKP